MDLDLYFRFLLALIFVLGLIGVLAWAARRFGFGGRFAAMKGRDARLAVVESLMIDSKRRLVLVRRDDREHLLVLGPSSESVVESGIAARPAAPSSTVTPAAVTPAAGQPI